VKFIISGNKEKINSEWQKIYVKFDSEVILQAYDEWVKNVLREFIGMFVFVIYDELSNNIFLQETELE
jgi:asparagine synthetase B (glutamine-hydrolysing)